MGAVITKGLGVPVVENPVATHCQSVTQETPFNWVSVAPV